MHILPTLRFRNTWSWKIGAPKPTIAKLDGADVEAKHEKLGTFRLYCEENPELLFCENETNFRKLFNSDQSTGYFKDGINSCIVEGDKSAVNPEGVGSKVAAHYYANIPGGRSATFRVRLPMPSSQTRLPMPTQF